MAAEWEFEVTNKSLLMDALAKALPDDLIYSLCVLERTHGERILLIVRGEYWEPSDLSPNGHWADPCDGSVVNILPTE